MADLTINATVTSGVGITATVTNNSPTYAGTVASGATGAQGPPGATGATGPQGPQGDTGPTGATGAAGADGVDGADGANGLSVLNGTVDPTTEGVDGDFYINTTSHTIFGPKTSGAWGSGTSLVGPTGATGAAGADGVDGATWYSGSGAPSAGTGVNGDFYLRTDTDDIYSKSGGSWSVLMNIKGATGATGATGAAGADGTNGSVWYEGAGAPSTTHNDGDFYLNTSNGDVYQQTSGAWGSPVGNLQGPAGAGTGDMLLGTAQTVTADKTFNAGTLLDKGEIVYDVKAYGANGDGTTDDTTAIQAAIDAANTAGGGVVFFPIGTYKITAALVIHSRQVIKGAGTNATIIRQFTNNTDAITMVDGIYTTIRDLAVDTNTGVTHTTNSGIKLTWSSNGNVEQINLTNLLVKGYHYGIYMETLITSQLSNIEAYGNDIGFYWTNGGTSTTIQNTYANNNGVGYQLDGCVYMAFAGTAADSNAISYYLNNCSGISFTGCGAESPTTGGSAPNDGRMWYLTGCVGISLYNCWTYFNGKYAFYAANSSSILLANFTENTPNTTPAPTNAIYIHTDCARVVVISPNTTTANQLQSGGVITTLIGDNGSAATLPGNLTLGSVLGPLWVNGANGNLFLRADTDASEFNLGSDASGTLSIYGSAGATLHLNLFDGDLKTGGTVRLTNGGVLQNINGSASITAAAGNNRSAFFQTAGGNRVELGASNAAESGSNAGSDFFINLYDDSGAYLSTPFTIARATGIATFYDGYVGRKIPRIGSTTSSATPTINTDNYDEYDITALAANITSMTTNLSGTPNNGQELILRFKDNGSARTITWGASFTSSGVATLLATTVASKTHYVKLRYDSTAAKWVCLAVDATGY